MVKIPGSIPAPVVPPMPPKKKEEATEVQRPITPSRTSIARELFELDARGIAVRMAALAHDAKEKELSFDEIVEKVIKETGIVDAQAAMEEGNRKLQKEIEDEIDKIKKNKDLMEEAYSWEELADILENSMTQDQIKEFVGILEKEIQTKK
ncbi:MAG: hypothetical protein NTZ10_05075 [Candidatus Saganbacteria bacterium]|nr:hypothetical protein [Candidatus Saganbacteria bacterium]